MRLLGRDTDSSGAPKQKKITLLPTGVNAIYNNESQSNKTNVRVGWMALTNTPENATRWSTSPAYLAQAYLQDKRKSLHFCSVQNP
jgi:hypothetical protein